MSLLETLPNEVLHQIFRYFQDDCGTLCVISRSSRRLYDAVTPFIYKNIKVAMSVRPPRAQRPVSPVLPSPLDRIKWSVTRNPGLGSFVRSAYFESDDQYHRERAPDDGSFVRLSRLVAAMPELETLQVKFEDHVNGEFRRWMFLELQRGRTEEEVEDQRKIRSKVVKTARFNLRFLDYDKPRFDTGFLDASPMACLRTVRIQDRRLASSDLTRLLLHESIESVTAINFEDSQVPYFDLPTMPISPKKHTVSLAMEQVGKFPLHVHGDVLQDIFKICSTILKTLECLIPGDYASLASRATEAVPGQVWNVDYPEVSSALLQTALEPVKDRLVKLKVCRCGNLVKRFTNNSYNPVASDGSHCNFTSFSSLRDLSVTSVCLIGSASPRLEIFKLLPAGLEKLEIRFENDSGVFWNCRDHWEANGKRITPEHYRWLVTIAEHKATRYPNLVQVKLVESSMKRSALPGMLSSSSGYQWELPADLKERAEYAGIAFEVWLQD